MALTGSALFACFSGCSNIAAKPSSLTALNSPHDTMCDATWLCIELDRQHCSPCEVAAGVSCYSIALQVQLLLVCHVQHSHYTAVPLCLGVTTGCCRTG